MNTHHLKQAFEAVKLIRGTFMYENALQLAANLTPETPVFLITAIFNGADIVLDANGEPQLTMPRFH